jgi:patatin-like phospholipase/acyl hydrolase
MDKKTLKILSIDGGGAKALYSLYVLKVIEDRFCKENECLADYFDMVCGTSAGGIVALGISNRVRIDDIVKFFTDNIQLIFPPSNGYISSIWYTFKQLTGYKYGNEVLKEKLEGFFGEKTVADSNTLLCVPSFSIVDHSNVVFKYPHKEGKLFRDHSVKMSDVAMATASAPTYFPVYHFDSSKIGGYFVDGGIWANNPQFVGIMEACKYFVGNEKKYGSYDVLSIGNIKTDYIKDPEKVKNYWSLLNIENLMNIIFDSSGHAIEHYTDVINTMTGGRVTRVECVDALCDNEMSATLDNSSKEFLNFMHHKGMSDGARAVEKEAIDRFFVSRKTYMTQ